MSKEFILTIDLEHPDAQKYGAIASILQSAASHFISDIDDWSAAPEDSSGTIRTLHGEPGFWEISGVTIHPRDQLLADYGEWVRTLAARGERDRIVTFDKWEADRREAHGVSWPDATRNMIDAAARLCIDLDQANAMQSEYLRAQVELIADSEYVEAFDDDFDGKRDAIRKAILEQARVYSGSHEEEVERKIADHEMRGTYDEASGEVEWH